MNKDSIIDFWGFITVRALSILFCRLPLGTALWIGRHIGDLALFFNVKRRSIGYANLKSAFPGKGTREIKRILRSHYRNLGMSIAELLKLPVMGKRYLDTHVEFLDFDRVEKALERGKGVILLTGHFGNWEISSLTVNSRGRKISVFAREQKYTRLNSLLNRYREITGCKVIAKGFSIREIIRSLHSNGIVGMLADQDAGPNGIFVNFLNRPASTPPGPVSFGLKTGASILPCFIRRDGFDKHIIEIGQPMKLIDTGNKDKDIKENLEQVVATLEGYIKRDPDQWLWSHKRWKSTPQRTVLVLSDGKAGHRNQAIAVAEMIEAALGSRLKARGIGETPIVKTRVVELKFKNRFARILLDIASVFARPRCQGCLRCLRFCLNRNSFEEIKRYTDIIVSCGASTVGAGSFLKYENNAKGIVIMKPGLCRNKKFDLVILPRHDALRKLRPNMMVTEVAPNRVVSECQSVRVSECRGIGLLIGGDAKNYRLEKKTVEEVVNSILKVSEEMSLDIFASTSRRTSREIDNLVKERLGNCPRCRLVIIANEDNREGVVQEIFDQSELVVVSPESISMISEAVSSGRHVVAFESQSAERRAQNSKYRKNIKNLEKKGYIRIADPDKIYETIKKLLTEKPGLRKIDDRESIIKRLESLM
jgi:KDO2-lipid IV(A) lauroyltransferase